MTNLLTDEQRAQFKAADAKRRAVSSCLAQCPSVLKIVAEANALKNDKVRSQVLELIRMGLENADDTATEATYAREYAAEFDAGWFRKYNPTRQAYWEHTFFSSVQSCSCYPRDYFGTERLDGRVAKWLHRRGLLG